MTPKIVTTRERESSEKSNETEDVCHSPEADDDSSKQPLRRTRQ